MDRDEIESIHEGPDKVVYMNTILYMIVGILLLIALAPMIS